MLAAVLAAGCGTQLAGRGQVSVQGCAAYGISAIDHHVTVTRLPAACRGLSKIQLNQAAATAINTVVGGRSKRPGWRQRTAEVAPLLEYLITEPQPERGTPAQPYQPAVGPAPTPHPGRDLAIGLAALGVWAITAGSGGYLLGSWFVHSGIRRRRHTSAGVPPAILLGHFGLALTGLLIWVSYLAVGWTALAWTAAWLLLPVAGLGMAVLVVGLPSGQSGTGGARAGARPARRGGRAPVLFIAGHGLLAVITMFVVFIAAIGTG